ncbi:MAG TPA: ATP-binding protein [Ktedonobacteraceae bacterium]|jgi:signal transduction histidine kinase/PAS domain-containing protein|nr:ATP-binding protein [Ktedonobacteraceae bacterium]
MEHKEFAEVSLSGDLPHQTTPDLAQNEPEASKNYDHSMWNWKDIRRVLLAATFTPTWLPAPWNTPLVGYLASLCLPALMALFTMFVLHIFPTFFLRGIFALSSVLLVALLWGTGPGLVATLCGTILLNFLLLSPSFTWNLSSVQPVLETATFLVFGIAICLIVSRIEYARSHAERAHRQIQQLVTQLEQEKAQAAAQANELEAIVTAIVDGIYVYDSAYHVRRTNPAAQLFNPYTQQGDYLDQPYPDRFSAFFLRDEQGQPLMRENLPVTRVLQGEVLVGSHTVDITMRTVDGEDHIFNVSGAPVRGQAGDVQGAVVVMRDVTELRRGAQRTRAALQALLQFAEALVQARITQKQILENDGEENNGENGIDMVAQRLAGLMSQVVGYPFVSLTVFKEATHELQSRAIVGMSTEHEQAWRERQPGFTVHELVAGTSIERRIIAGEAVILDLREPPFAGRPNVYGSKKLLLMPMMLEGRIVGVVTYDAGDPSHDYSEQEIALARALAQLAALTVERSRLFQERTEAQASILALRETNRLMDEFIGIAGHELRTPLTTIQGSVQLAKRQINRALKQQASLPGEVSAMLTTIQGHLERTERQIRMQNRLISDLLDVARIHANRLELHPQLCDLLPIVRESVEDQHYLAPARTIELTTPVTDEVLVMGDADRLRQVISNFLSNALKYSEADKPVEVCLELAGSVVKISVRDEGPGLSREQQQRIWERFYRVPEVEVKSGSGVGLGLGLHISRMIIERLGGQIGVQSSPGQGSTFWFTLPRAEPD